MRVQFFLRFLGSRFFLYNHPNKAIVTKVNNRAEPCKMYLQWLPPLAFTDSLKTACPALHRDQNIVVWSQEKWVMS